VSIAVRPELEDLPLRQRRAREAELAELNGDSEEEVTPAPPRTCVECGKPVPAGRQTTCGPECGKVARQRRDRERKKRPKPASASVPGPPSLNGGPELVDVVALAELEPESSSTTPPERSYSAPLELEATSSHTGTKSPPPVLEAGGVAVTLADELETAAGLLRRIARRLTG
jgi:predicted nucleic acid-binding Zn ribbon protein